MDPTSGTKWVRIGNGEFVGVAATADERKSSGRLGREGFGVDIENRNWVRDWIRA